MSLKQSAARRGPAKANVRSKTIGGEEGGAVAEVDLERERAALIQERQRELDIVIDKHDTLVCTFSIYFREAVSASCHSTGMAAALPLR